MTALCLTEYEELEVTQDPKRAKLADLFSYDKKAALGEPKPCPKCGEPLTAVCHLPDHTVYECFECGWHSSHEKAQSKEN